MKARRGYFVTPVTRRALFEGYDVRLALESHAADVAVDTASDEQIAALRARLDATADAISHEEWDTANAAFGTNLEPLSTNEILQNAGLKYDPAAGPGA